MLENPERARRWQLASKKRDLCRTALSMEVVTKYLNRLRDAGIVIAPRGKLYEIDPRFLADKENHVLDFGPCSLRLKNAL